MHDIWLIANSYLALHYYINLTLALLSKVFENMFVALVEEKNFTLIVF